jgi:Dyp-type peroxidase family
MLLILNAQTPAQRDSWRDRQRAALRRTNGGVVEHEDIAQYGVRPAHGKEPFGFFDGAAQPEIKGVKGQGVNTGEFILGYRNEYDFLPASPMVPVAADWQGLLPRPANPNHAVAGYRDLGFNGSFVVYRKLQQDVAGFWRFMQNEATRYTGEPDPEFMVWMASKLVGRWPSGAPLVLSPIRDQPEQARRDDFLYATADPLGLACPLGAHIRRTNPRDVIRPSGPRESLHMTARHRLLRRGKPYGDPLFDLTALDHPEDRARLQKAIVDLRDDARPRGIHFLCVNASIKSQFEFVQQAWTNNPHFNGLTHYQPASTDDAGRALDPTGSLYVPGSPFGLRTSPLPRFVTTRGGAYFFMPSLTALRFLAAMHTMQH